jgi:predicted small secreted protein
MLALSFGILVAGASLLRRLERMGAKYLPSIKDLKANQRFLQQQRPLPKFAKPAPGQAGKRGKKK